MAERNETGVRDFSREELEERVYLASADIVVCRERPGTCLAWVDAVFARIDQLTAQLPSFRFVVDLTEGGRPDAALRARLRHHVSQNSRLAHVGFVFGDNVFVRIGARFIMAAMGARSHAQYRSIEEAIERLSDDGR